MAAKLPQCVSALNFRLPAWPCGGRYGRYDVPLHPRPEHRVPRSFGSRDPKVRPGAHSRAAKRARGQGPWVPGASVLHTKLSRRRDQGCLGASAGRGWRPTRARLRLARGKSPGPWKENLAGAMPGSPDCLESTEKRGGRRDPETYPRPSPSLLHHHHPSYSVFFWRKCSRKSKLTRM